MRNQPIRANVSLQLVLVLLSANLAQAQEMSKTERVVAASTSAAITANIASWEFNTSAQTLDKNAQSLQKQMEDTLEKSRKVETTGEALHQTTHSLNHATVKYEKYGSISNVGRPDTQIYNAIENQVDSARAEHLKELAAGRNDAFLSQKKAGIILRDLRASNASKVELKVERFIGLVENSKDSKGLSKFGLHKAVDVLSGTPAEVANQFEAQIKAGRIMEVVIKRQTLSAPQPRGKDVVRLIEDKKEAVRLTKQSRALRTGGKIAKYVAIGGAVVAGGSIVLDMSASACGQVESSLCERLKQQSESSSGQGSTGRSIQNGVADN